MKLGRALLERIKGLTSRIKPDDRVVWRGARGTGEIDGIAYFGYAIKCFGPNWKVKYDSGKERALPVAGMHLSKVLPNSNYW